MNIVEIYKQPSNVIWYDEKTFLFVFDDNEKQIADYDLSSGLKLMTDGKNIIIFINDDDLIPGKWKFFGTKMVKKNNKLAQEKVYAEGYKEGEYLDREYNPKNVWNDPKHETNDDTVIKQERTVMINEEQHQFEKELEEYLRGL